MAKDAQPPALRLLPRAASSDDTAALSSWQSRLRASLQTIEIGRRLIVDLAPVVKGDALTQPRYSLTIIDTAHTAAVTRARCGILIVPQGRESEFLFGHPEGQQSLAHQQSFHRLIFVTLNRGHTFPSLSSVQSELRPHVRGLLPDGSTGESVPFLAVSDDVGERRAVSTMTGDSGGNGDLIVEDVRVGGHWHRRLVFTKTNYPQSEARLIGAKKSASIDYGYVPSAYQQTILTALSLTDRPLSTVLMIGLGGGNIQMFLSLAMPTINITVVEIDSAVLAQAQSFFGFRQHDRLSCSIEDGLRYLEGSSRWFDAVIVDCNSADLSEGLSFPPMDFLSPTTLKNIRRSLYDRGVFVLNFGCRQQSLRRSLIATMYEAMSSDDRGSLYELEVDNDSVNTIITAVINDNPSPVAPVTQCALLSRVLTPDRVSQYRSEAQFSMTETQRSLPFTMDRDMSLTDRCDNVRRFVRVGDGSIKSVLVPVCEHEPQCAIDGGVSEDLSSMSAEDRKRAKARAKKQKQKQRKKTAAATNDGDAESGADAVST